MMRRLIRFSMAACAGLALNPAGFAAHATDCSATPWRCPQPAYSGYGTPPAPPSPAPPPDQLAAAQKALTACQRAAAVPNAQAVGPCMYHHGWTDKMTLDCSYGNKPNVAACYIPRGH